MRPLFKRRYNSGYIARILLFGGMFNLIALWLLIYKFGPSLTNDRGERFSFAEMVNLHSAAINMPDDQFDHHHPRRRTHDEDPDDEHFDDKPYEPGPTLAPFIVEHVQRDYDGVTGNDQKSHHNGAVPFDISTIFGIANYSSSLSSHHTALYSNASNQHLAFHHLKPQCVRQHSVESMCFLSECHDTSPQSTFDHKMAALNRSFFVSHSEYHPVMKSVADEQA